MGSQLIWWLLAIERIAFEVTISSRLHEIEQAHLIR